MVDRQGGVFPVMTQDNGGPIATGDVDAAGSTDGRREDEIVELNGEFVFNFRARQIPRSARSSRCRKNRLPEFLERPVQAFLNQ